MSDWTDYLGQIGNAANAANSSLAPLTSPTTGYPIQGAINPNAQNPNQAGQSIAQIVNGIKGAIQMRNMSANGGNSAASDTGSNQAANSVDLGQAATDAMQPVGMGATAPATSTSAPAMVDTTDNPSVGLQPINGLQDLSSGVNAARGGRISKYAVGGNVAQPFMNPFGTNSLGGGGNQAQVSGVSPNSAGAQLPVNSVNNPARGNSLASIFPGQSMPLQGSTTGASANPQGTVASLLGTLGSNGGATQGQNTTSNPGMPPSSGQGTGYNATGPGWSAPQSPAMNRPGMGNTAMPNGGLMNGARPPMRPQMGQPSAGPTGPANPMATSPTGMSQQPRGFARGGGIEMKGVHPIRIQKINAIRMVNPIKGFSEGGSMEDMGRTDHIDPGTADFETLAHGGEVDGMHEAAKHLRGIHHMLPKSAQPHNAKAHKAVLDELHNSFMGSASPQDDTQGPMEPIGPKTTPGVTDEAPPAEMDAKGGMVESKPEEKKEDKKEEAKKKKDHEKHSGGGAIFGKAGEEKAAKAHAGEKYARGGYVDPGTEEFGMTGGGTARGMGVATRGGKFTYRGGGCVKK